LLPTPSTFQGASTGCTLPFLSVARQRSSSKHFSETEFPILVHWARLRRAELFLKRDGPGDRDAAQAEFDALLP
jgi:hypothetical protein